MKYMETATLRALALLSFIPSLTLGNDKACLKQFGDKVYFPHPDMSLRTPQVIRKYGYPVETHTVTTEDGYILTLFRIPPSKDDPLRLPVLLSHGLFANGHIWLMQHGSKNLAFKLSNEGHDVWLGNGRGTRYSQKHTHLSPDKWKYWNFTFHEMGIYDFPAVLQYIIKVTEREKIYFVGHSMGTTELFIALSLLPHLNQLVATAFLYAPVAFLSNTLSISKHIAPFADELYLLTHKELRGHFNGLQWIEDILGQKLGEMCSYKFLACGICSEINARIFGRDPLQMNYTLQSLFFSHVPDSVSTKTLLHYSQLIRSGNFREFDYGSEEGNERHYGAGVIEPPDYPLSRITAPLVFFWSDNDNMATPMDVNITASAIRPEVLKENVRVGWYLWSHRDFVKGIDADKLVYAHTIRIIKERRYG